MATPYDFEQIFKEYHNKIYRLALSITHNEKDAEDIVQNTFIKILRKIGQFENRSKLSTWIYKIAYNEALMVVRKKRRTLTLTDSMDYYADVVPSGLVINWPKIPDQELLDAEMMRRLEKVIRRLPIQYRMPLLLQRIEGESLKTTADILGLKLNSLKTRLHRAHLYIKNEMDAYRKDREPTQNATVPEDKLCPVITRFLYDYAEGMLASGKKNEFDRHVKECSPCRVFLAAYLKAIKITKALQCNDIPVDLREKIKTFVRCVRAGKDTETEKIFNT
jgi:RNA polymerase sigma-70 factor (ECF subfamily)